MQVPPRFFKTGAANNIRLPPSYSEFLNDIYISICFYLKSKTI